jgi:hypothetical protein
MAKSPSILRLKDKLTMCLQLLHSDTVARVAMVTSYSLHFSLVSFHSGSKTIRSICPCQTVVVRLKDLVDLSFRALELVSFNEASSGRLT